MTERWRTLPAKKALFWVLFGGGFCLLLGGVPLGRGFAQPDSSLKNALVSGSVAAVRENLNERSSVDVIVDEKGNTPLLVAARNGHTGLVEWLLERGADPSRTNENGLAPVLTATASGHGAVVESLLHYGADPNVKPSGENPHLRVGPPLVQVARRGFEELALRLLREGARLEVRDRHGRTALLEASCRGDRSLVEAFLRWGASVNARDRYGWTPLICAVQNGRETVVESLLVRGADPSLRNNNGATALLLLSRMSLLEKGTIESSYPETVRRMFRLKPVDYDAMLQTLLEGGAYAGERDDRGNTALHRFTRTDRVNSVEVLLRYGASPLVRNDGGTTPLDLAYERDNGSLLEPLYREAYARPPADTADVHENLIEAVQRESPADVRRLLRKGASPYYENLTGWTALHGAVLHDRKRITQLLLDHGADPCRRNKFGVTPFSLYDENPLRLRFYARRPSDSIYGVRFLRQETGKLLGAIVRGCPDRGGSE